MRFPQPERDEAHAGMVRAGIDDPEIGIPVRDLRGDIEARADLEMHARHRLFHRETREHAVEEVMREGGRAGNPEIRLLVDRPPARAFQALQRLEDRLGLLVERQRLRRCEQTPAFAPEEHEACALLELRDGARNRRLRDVQLRGGGGGLSEADQRPQDFQFA